MKCDANAVVVSRIPRTCVFSLEQRLLQPAKVATSRRSHGHSLRCTIRSDEKAVWDKDHARKGRADCWSDGRNGITRNDWRTWQISPAARQRSASHARGCCAPGPRFYDRHQTRAWQASRNAIHQRVVQPGRSYRHRSSGLGRCRRHKRLSSSIRSFRTVLNASSAWSKESKHIDLRSKLLQSPRRSKIRREATGWASTFR